MAKPRRVKREIWNERANRWETHEVLLCPPSDQAGKRRGTEPAPLFSRGQRRARAVRRPGA